MYDVIIIGGRVAGASLAILLGKKGKRVLVVDKDRFPSDTLSSHHITHLGYLDQLGVLQDIEAEGFQRINRIRTYIEDCIFDGPRSHYTLAPRRNKLDKILVEHALKSGQVEFMERTSLLDLIFDNGKAVGVKIRQEDGSSREVRAEIVVGADGKDSKVASLVQAEQYDVQSNSRPFYYGYYNGILALEETTTEMFFQDGNIGMVFPLEPGVHCLALVIQNEQFQSFRQDARKSFETLFRKFYGMEKRMADAQLQGTILGTRGVSNFFRKPYGDGWLLTGDAAYLRDPSTGLGINDAFLQSFMLAEALERYYKGEEWNAVMQEYQSNRDGLVKPMYDLTLNFMESPIPSPSDMAMLRALVVNPFYASKWAPKLPSILENSAEFPKKLMEMAKGDAQYYS